LWKMQGKWQIGELSVLLTLLFHCTHQILINHRRSTTLLIIMHIFMYHWITRGMFSIHLIKPTMNVSRFRVSCIQEMDYRRHFICSGLLDFLEHCKHTGRCINVIWMSADGIHAFPKDQQTLQAWTPSWLQHCSSSICKRNLFRGCTSYLSDCAH
jgi:hypothetical protein